MKKAVLATMLALLFLASVSEAKDKRKKEKEAEETSQKVTIEVSVEAGAYVVGTGTSWGNHFYEPQSIPAGKSGEIRVINFKITPPRKKDIKNISAVRAITVISDNKLGVPASPTIEVSTKLDKYGQCASTYGLLADKDGTTFSLDHRRVQRDEFYLLQNGERKLFAVFEIEFLPGMREVNIVMVSPRNAYVGTKSKAQFLILM